MRLITKQKVSIWSAMPSWGQSLHCGVTDVLQPTSDSGNPLVGWGGGIITELISVYYGRRSKALWERIVHLKPPRSCYSAERLAHKKTAAITTRRDWHRFPLHDLRSRQVDDEWILTWWYWLGSLLSMLLWLQYSFVQLLVLLAKVYCICVSVMMFAVLRGVTYWCVDV